jgi:hypothetical protein
MAAPAAKTSITITATASVVDIALFSLRIGRPTSMARF